jgi:D-alanyl-D-alanine carboxypeptidase/D-alanyl-D-alanine-endopeptidase (penicillin-binding protein 4)
MRTSYLFSPVLIALFSFNVFAETSAPKPQWQKRFDEIVRKSNINPKKLGLIIARDAAETMAELNPDQPMTPASLTKVATAAAVLQKFPVGYQFLTQILGETEAVSEAYPGSIYLRGSGDAGFVSESMWFLVNEFTRTGVKEIKGDIVVDDSYFDSVRRDPSRDQAAVDRAYDSPIGAMTMNWSAVSVFVRPSKVGEPPHVFADPVNDYIKVINKAKTVKSGATKIEVTNTSIGQKVTTQETIIVSGTIALEAPEFVAYKSITQPEIWAAYNLKSFLEQRGIVLKGTVRTGVTPAKAVVLATSKSRPIGELVNTMMKWSSNYVAEILTKGLGAQIKGAPGTMEKGTTVVRDFLSQVGLKDIDYENPSGLSRKNSFRPRDLLKVLQYGERHFEFWPEYLTSLPIGGVDGTLRKRGHQTDTAGIVRAKTGHLAGVTGLAGYVGGKSGQVYTFVFLYNGGVEESVKAQDLFDRLIYDLQKADEKQESSEQ